jgi:hypothetical protein
MPTTVFDPSEGVSTNQQAAEAAALEQGEKLAQIAQQDQESRWEQQARDQENPALIGGKFKSQEDLLKAYEALQKKLGNKDQEEEDEPVEGDTDATEEAPKNESTSEAVSLMTRLGEEYAKNGDLSEADVDQLTQLDSKELVSAYIEYYKSGQQKAQVQATTESQVAEVVASVGGKDAYAEMISWAVDNLDQAEIDSYNSVTNSGNPAAIKFAVEALSNRYRNSEGFEAPLVSGRKADSGPKPYRSQAELARDIANPLYQQDPAFRADVEDRLSRSKDLL